MAFGDTATLISDFTGDDENPLSEGGNWANLNTSSNPLKRLAGAVTASVNLANNQSYWTPANFGPDLDAYVTVTTLSSGNAGIIARIQEEGGAATWDGYHVRANQGLTSNIYIITNGAYTLLLGGGPTFASGDKLGMRCAGSTIQLWRQASGSSTWDLGLTVDDATYSGAGKIGLYSSRTANVLDDFYAGVPPPPQLLRPDADLDAGTWTTAPLWSKVDEEVADAEVITATSA